VNEHCRLLHNMSAPPKTTVAYGGLARLTSTREPPPSKLATGTYGRPVAFRLDKRFRGGTASEILRQLGKRPGPEPDQKLEALLDARAAELPLPDGCVVIEYRAEHASIWRDRLTVLAVLTKCSDNVWLRSKLPSPARALTRRAVTLLVPPAFIAQLPETVR
jgi:hypothetical protein